MVKEGYKETEIGVFPIDWNIKRIKDIATPKARIGWQNLRKEEYLKNGDYLLITGTDFLDGKVILDKCCYVSKERYTQDHNIQVSNGAILITKDGTLGKVAFVEGLTKPATLNAGVFVLNNLDACVSNYYLYQYLRTDALLEYALKTSTGGTIQHLNQNVLINFCVPCPTLEEQQKIAEALSDMDNLIAALEKLIEKKNAIKQACLKKMFPTNGEMQPHMRLPGFTDSWKPQKLGTITAYKNGKSFENQQIENGKYELVTLNSISIDGGLKASGKFVNNAYDTLLKNDLVMVLSDVGHGDLLGRVALIPQNNKFVLNQRVALLRIVDQTDPLFLFFYINANQNYFKTKGAGSSQLNISKECVEQFVVNLPSLKEQIKISEFFCDLDNVIENSQQKLEKCKKIKQGMMQQLLTGKIRLVSNDDGVTDKPEVDTLKSSSKGHNHQFDDAVVIAGIVDKFYSDKYYLGRKKVQKLLYLFRRHQEADISAFKKKAAGPYADEVRYKGGEPIAIGNKYISVKKGSKGSSFSKGEKIADALTYLENWNLNDDIKWLCEQFKYIKTDRLELLATIDMAMCDLDDAGITVTVDSIKELIKSHSEWKTKLSKSYFKDNDIAWAIRECRRLFG